PLPSRKLSPRDAFIAASTLYAICLILGFLLNYKAGLMVIALIMISHAYNALLKERGIWGSISLPVGIGLLSVFGALAVSGTVPTLVWYVFAATTLFDFGTHITTTFKDIERDKSIGVATTPLQIGVKPALAVSWIVTIAACVVALLPCVIGNVNYRYSLWVILALVATCVTRIPLIFHQTEKNGYLALKGSMIASITFFPSLMGIAMPIWQSALIILPLLAVTITLLQMVKQEV
ncbi:MAG: UbiA prenyltransferase family protein, partial [Candidatus Poribacteria bacterium]